MAGRGVGAQRPGSPWSAPYRELTSVKAASTVAYEGERRCQARSCLSAVSGDADKPDDEGTHVECLRIVLEVNRALQIQLMKIPSAYPGGWREVVTPNIDPTSDALVLADHVVSLAFPLLGRGAEVEPGRGLEERYEHLHR